MKTRKLLPPHQSARPGRKQPLLRLLALFFALLTCGFDAAAQSRVIVGYFHNWNNASAPYIRLRDVDSRYNVIDIAFATPVAYGDMTMTFTPTQQSKAEFIADIRTLQSQGRKVLISIGGADAPVELNTTADKDKFVTSMKAIITEYGFDGFDIDLEGTSVILNSGDTNFKSSTTPKINNLVTAARELTTYYRGQGKDFWLTSAPEVQYVQGGYGNYGTAFGGYLPVLYGLRDLLTFVHVQYYNTGSQNALDDKIYSQGTADFIVAMTDMLLKGFPVARNAANFFPALRQDQVAFGLPATGNGAAPAGGYVTPADVTKALNYLVKGISYGGQYVLNTTYPNLRGIMTWSINWDKTQNYPFVTNAYNFFSTLGTPNTPPTVSLTGPANNATFAAPATITLTANAADANGTVSKVEFFQGATKLGEDLTAPYSFSWSSVSAGTYSLTARATDNAGAATTSAAVSVTVTGGTTNTPPTVSLTAPASGAAYPAPASITITANAADANGTVSKVEFFQGTTKLGEDLSAPYSFSWSSVAAGTYSLTARATDNSGAVTTSAAVSVTVTGGSTGGCTVAAWSATAVYTKDMQASRNGNVYVAKWWTQNEDPITASCQYCPWQLVGPCASARATAPADIAAELLVYPNPVQGSALTVELGRSYEQVTVVVVNDRGHEASRATYQNVASLQLPVTKLPKGLLVLRITADGKTLTKRIMNQ
ncbi:Ig-like domain-containing protein [Hymenobacter cellulosivorans]|uniref:chitinase n=1 Tax=Hymenobacter cellulosivorans TaxID=2932249 RepID=A0ABY4FBK9_9BACT|nr:Ig-like domain-containing protein [Hymenobacter cellulosivorans]UOQ51836.1 Ig-like domain-containing protein [Hymenobacter cellulosivorans]